MNANTLSLLGKGKFTGFILKISFLYKQFNPLYLETRSSCNLISNLIV